MKSVEKNNTWEKCGKGVKKIVGKNSMGKVWKIFGKNMKKIS